jgi:hypothetical protein
MAPRLRAFSLLSPNLVVSCEDFGAPLLLLLPTTKERGATVFS